MKKLLYRVVLCVAQLSLCVCACLVLQVREGQAASAHGASGGWFVRAADAGSSSVWFGTLNWASTAVINWTVPTFTADGTPLPTAPVPFSESKFNTTGALPTALTWTGYNISGTGPLGSKAYSTGAGSSSVGLLFYGAKWNVTASGAGTYDVQAVATDPWPIFPEDFTTISDPTYSLWIPFSAISGDALPLGLSTLSSGYGWNVSYATSDGVFSLLDISVNGTTVGVTTSSTLASSLSFYQEADSTTAPTGSTQPGTLLTLSQLDTLITGSVNAGGDWLNELDLGILLNNIPIPTTTMSDGSVAYISVSAEAHQSGVTPEPCTLALMGLGAAGAAYMGRRNRAKNG